MTTPASGDLDALHKEFHLCYPHIRYGDPRCPVCKQWRANAMRSKR